MVLVVTMVGLGAVSVWADEPTDEPSPPPQPPPAETPQPPPAETPQPPPLLPADAPALAPGAEAEAGPLEPQERGSGGPPALPIGSTDPSGSTDISAISGITSGSSDGVLVPAPPQSEHGLEPMIEGGPTGPDPTDLTLLG